jgi:hypothetical protein
MNVENVSRFAGITDRLIDLNAQKSTVEYRGLFPREYTNRIITRSKLQKMTVFLYSMIDEEGRTKMNNAELRRYAEQIILSGVYVLPGGKWAKQPNSRQNYLEIISHCQDYANRRDIMIMTNEEGNKPKKTKKEKCEV